jgi:phosphoglycerol transferase MdoB-like AlkP superfamily enzyme
MAEKFAGGGAGADRKTSIENSGLRPAAVYGLGAKSVVVAALLAAVGVGLYFRRWEGGAPNLFFVWSCTLLIAASIVFATRRVLVAAVLVPALIAIVDRAAVAKHKAMDMVVHAYDIVFYLSSWSTLVFLWSEYRFHLVALAGALLATLIAAVVAHRLDATRVSRAYSLAGLAACALAVAVAANVKGERRNTQYYWEDLVVSSFYSSWAETVEAIWRGQLIEAADRPRGSALAATNPSPLTVSQTCETRQTPPHIILIHQESVVPPEYFPQLSYDRSVDRFFRSGDGELHRMRVETYGGASWLTEFSLLAGVSTYSFGGMRPFVQSLMAGKVRDTLPQRLATCGYRNVVFYPLNRNFVSNAKFYTSVGMGEIFDIEDQGAKSGTERDHFYYNNALSLMEKHFAGSRQPLFTFILTMATHGPYLSPYSPEVDVPGGGPGTNPEMHEYLRRLSMARIDYDYLIGELKRRFPDERFLIVHYGDHHPNATRAYLGFGAVRDPEDVALARDSLGFLTYYSVQGLNYEPPPLPALDTLDVAYLGTTLLEAAGLPLSDAYQERKRLMTLCEGRYYDCRERQEILSFHRRLIDSGLIDQR